MEATLAELADGRVYMLIRTVKGWFWEAFSDDGGLTWRDFARSQLRSSTCCGQLARLADGRLILLWNRSPVGKPYNLNSRAELSIAFSSDEAKTWSKPVVVSQRELQPGEEYYAARQSYPYVLERRPGELWITTMQGGLRMKINTADIPDEAWPKAVKIVALGSSTTAPRGSVKQSTAIGSTSCCATAACRSRSSTRVSAARRPSTRECGSKGRPGPRPGAGDHHAGRQRLGHRRLEEPTRHHAPRCERALRREPAQLRQDAQGPQREGHPDGPAALPLDGEAQAALRQAALRRERPWGFSAKLAEYCDVVRAIAREEDVPLVDVFKAFREYDAVDGQSVDDLLLDGMHPNDKGHAIIAELLAPLVQEACE